MSGMTDHEGQALDRFRPPLDEEILAYARSRGVTEVLHFTTDRGLLGAAATGAVLSRDAMYNERRVEYIRLFNCKDRTRDANWTGHVSLSITQINRDLLSSSRRWHSGEDVFWCILGFDVSILGHPEVYFADSNNAYPITKRKLGITGLAGMFAEVVRWGYFNTAAYRTKTKPLNLPTQEQAEVLYPSRVPLQWLRHIYLSSEEYFDWAASLPEMFTAMPPVPVVCKPEVFE